MQYPQNLYNDTFPNGICFEILAKKSTANKFNKGFSELTSTERQDLNNQNRANSDNYESIKTQAFTAGGAAGGYGLNKIVGGDNQSGFAKLTSAVVGGGTGYAAAKLTGGNQEIVKLSGAIDLFVPQSIVTAYSANWDEVDLGPIAGKVATGGGSVADVLKSGGETVELLGRGAAAAAANIPAAVGVGDINLGDVFEATSKKVGNPYKEQLFKSMGFRQFSFSYTFSPRNSTETNAVNEIIQTFKANMHPDVSPDGMFLIYPSEFRISFKYKGATNTTLPKISNCALKNVKLAYGPDGMFNTFQGTDGQASEITMELQFVELETLTREKVEDGF